MFFYSVFRAVFLGEKRLENGRFFLSPFFGRFWNVFGSLKNECFSAPFFGRFFLGEKRPKNGRFFICVFWTFLGRFWKS